MLIRNSRKNVSISVGHKYTVEKVKAAMEFISKSGRNTTLQQWVDMYNYLKDANESVKGCQPCAASKFTASVRNYAKYGYLTLLNEGHTPEEFVVGKKEKEEVENKEERIVLSKSEIEEVKDDVIEEVVEEKAEEVSVPKKKGGRKKK